MISVVTGVDLGWTTSTTKEMQNMGIVVRPKETVINSKVRYDNNQSEINQLESEII